MSGDQHAGSARGYLALNHPKARSYPSSFSRAGQFTGSLSAPVFNPSSSRPSIVGLNRITAAERCCPSPFPSASYASWASFKALRSQVCRLRPFQQHPAFRLRAISPSRPTVIQQQAWSKTAKDPRPVLTICAGTTCKSASAQHRVLGRRQFSTIFGVLAWPGHRRPILRNIRSSVHTRMA
jgi:hypothetical protein